MKVLFSGVVYPSTSHPAFKSALVSAGAVNYRLVVIEYSPFDASGKVGPTESIAIVEPKT